MYSRITKERYCEIPVSDGENKVACCPYYVYSSIENLANRKEPDNALGYCRTIGILQSYQGYFYICHITSTGGVAPDIKVRVSLAYLKTLPQNVTPYPVQIFGSMRQCRGIFVIVAKLLQVLTLSRALQMKGTMNLIANSHCSNG